MATSPKDPDGRICPETKLIKLIRICQKCSATGKALSTNTFEYMCVSQVFDGIFVDFELGRKIAVAPQRFAAEFAQASES